MDRGNIKVCTGPGQLQSMNAHDSCVSSGRSCAYPVSLHEFAELSAPEVLRDVEPGVP